jgi:CspA family cold shock protein
MTDGRKAITCQRCGMGFMMTENYRAYLDKWGANLVVPVQCLNCFWHAGPLPKQRGQVKWFNPRKQYGFIVDENGCEVFFHQKQLLEPDGDYPHEGEPVRFHVRYAAKGPEAVNIETIDI